MMLLPEGFVLPGLPYLAVLAVCLVFVVALLAALGPDVNDWTVVAFVPWMATGGVLYVLYQMGAVVDVVAPLFSAPTVYATTAVFLGAAWLGSMALAELRRSAMVARQLGVVGLGIAIMFATYAALLAYQAGTFRPAWPLLALVAAVGLTGLAWVVLMIRWGNAVLTTKQTGLVVIFGHTLDGVSTAVGIDVLGASERTPLSRLILEAAGSLPTADAIGVGWAFVLVKVALACLIVVSFAEYLRVRPRVGRLVMALVAAVGMGPGMHNLLLFAVSG